MGFQPASKRRSESDVAGTCWGGRWGSLRGSEKRAGRQADWAVTLGDAFSVSQLLNLPFAPSCVSSWELVQVMYQG